jgi:putative ABC transport system permease protein
MSLFSVLGAIEIGLIFALVSLGVYITFRLLRFPDLTVDGSFATGGAVCAILIANNWNPFLSTLIATLAGGAAGFITGWLNVKLKIMDLLASILMMIALYSVNLRIMGGPNVPLINDATVFTVLQPAGVPDFWFRPILLLIIVIIAKFGTDWFFSTERGLAIRSTGSNTRMARAQGINTSAMVLLGVAISNGFVGLAGALYAQSQGGSDASMGIGTIVVGLAAVIVGEAILPSRRVAWATLAVIIGAVIYRFFIAAALNSNFIGLKAQDLNLITAVLVTIALIVPNLKRLLQGKRLPDAPKSL